MSDGLYWAAKVAPDGGISFYRDSQPTPGAAEFAMSGIDVRFLTMIDGIVCKKSDNEIASIIAADKDAQDAATAAEELRQQEELDALEIKNAKITLLRDSYINTTQLFCQLAGLSPVNKIEDAIVIMNAIQNSEEPIKSQLFMLSMQLKFLIDELRRPSMDGDDAWDRI